MGQRTPLYECHVSAHAKIVDFGGWDMPVLYSSIQEEHHATRNGVGIFDISHMGRLAFIGDDAARELDRLLSNRMDNLEPGQVRYSLALNENAGILDDLLVTRLEGRHLVVVNASNRLKVVRWFLKQLESSNTSLKDHTHDTAMIALQGPKAITLAAKVLSRPIDSVAYYHAVEVEVLDQPAIVSRTGYTGEDGCEIICPSDSAIPLWETLLDAGKSLGAKTVGLGARDTLRLEAGMPLYGHELSEDIDPIQAGLGWAVKTKNREFLGKKAILDRPADRPVRIGLELEGKRIPREGFDVLGGVNKIGHVTSGTFSPSLNRPIAMAYVDPRFAKPDTELGIDIRGTQVPARVVPLPFYKRS